MCSIQYQYYIVTRCIRIMKIFLKKSIACSVLLMILIIWLIEKLSPNKASELIFYMFFIYVFILVAFLVIRTLIKVIKKDWENIYIYIIDLVICGGLAIFFASAGALAA